MGFTLAYWHWLVLGMLLVLAEIFIPSFTIFWFGLAAIIVSGVTLIIPGISITWQLFCWAIASCLLTFLWFKFFKPKMVDRTNAGIAKEAIIGQAGQVIKAPMDGRNGVVRFSVPLLGADEWSFFCLHPVAVGDRVLVKDISGNSLVVEKPTPTTE